MKAFYIYLATAVVGLLGLLDALGQMEKSAPQVLAVSVIQLVVCSILFIIALIMIYLTREDT